LSGQDEENGKQPGLHPNTIRWNTDAFSILASGCRPTVVVEPSIGSLHVGVTLWITVVICLLGFDLRPAMNVFRTA
jgi:hypothetical protein